MANEVKDELKIKGEGSERQGTDLDARIRYTDKKTTITEDFIKTIVDGADVDETVELFESPESHFGEMYVATFGLDKDHIMYVLLPKDFIDGQRTEETK